MTADLRTKTKKRRQRRLKAERVERAKHSDTEPDWGGECDICGSSPVMPITGMCGPCSTGESETIGGNW